ncbi:TolC family protein [Rubrivirga sp.]|uniref:TolC family protein n=1 Tax=Rubrivirga sp. TaxID=1885344 RepID=UPI003C71F6D4
MAYTQTTLTLEEAIRSTIEQNPSIQIQRQETQLAQNNVFKANAGLLPTIDAVAGGSYLNNYADVKLRTFQPEPSPEFINVDEFGVETINANVGVQAEYLLYDGGRGNTRLLLLEGLSKLERNKQEVLINQTVLGVTQLYLDVLKLQNQAAFLADNIENSEIRLQKMEDRKQFGKANSLSILQLQTALNQDEAALDDVRLATTNLVKELNFLMGAPLDQTIVAQEIANTFVLPDVAQIYASVQANNPQLQLSQAGIAIAGTELKLSELDRKPTVGAIANLGYNFQRNDVQQLAEIHTAGVLIGVSASYNLFDGGVRNNRIQNAKINLSIANERQRLTENDLFKQALQARDSYLLIQSQLEREQRNLSTFEAAYEKAQELFLVGKANNLALRDAELARLNVLLRIDQLKADLYKTQLQLQQLMGGLVE